MITITLINNTINIINIIGYSIINPTIRNSTINIPMALANVIGSSPKSSILPHKFFIRVFIDFN